MVLVIGAAGAFGRAMVRALQARAVPVRALVRRPVDLPDVDVRVGDAANLGDVLEHSEGCDTLVLAMNLPWTQLDPQLLKIMTSCIDAAVERQATVVFPTNVDGVKPIFEVPLPIPPPVLDVTDPPVRKGEFRNVLENQVRQFVERLEGRAIVVRSNDYFGPGVTGRPFGPLQARLLRGGPTPWYGALDVARPLAFVDDAADLAASALLVARSPYVELTVPAHVKLPAEWVAAFGGGAVLRERKGWEMSLRGLWDRDEREQIELMYNWKGPLLLSDAPTRALLPSWSPTPLEAAIARTRAWAGL